MRTQTQSKRQRLAEQQSLQFLNESELPFSAPPFPAVVDADSFVTTAATLQARNNASPRANPP
jgi:hypothetical protein